MRYLALSAIAITLASQASASTLLDFGNSTVVNNSLTNGATNASGGNIRWQNIANLDGQSLDLVATVVGGTYNAANADPAKLALNGLNGDFGNINLNNDTYVEFKFTIVETGTTNGVVASSWDFAFFDLDTGTGNSNHESITIISGEVLESYTISSQTEIDASGLYPNRTFTATTSGGVDDNPDDPTMLTALQEQRSILFTLTDTDFFTLAMGTTPGSNGRNIQFAGEAVFDDFPAMVVTGVPEPSAFALLGFGSALLLRRRRV